MQPLHLVHDELMVTLNDVRVALEQYADGGLGSVPLERCANLLHTVRGVLQLTETGGACLLAEEMEQTCRHLLRNRRDPHPDEAIETVMRAAVQLPAYIERLCAGGRDVPLILLPLLNDLRATRGRPLLSESTLLLLNLGPASGEPKVIERRVSGEDIAALCRGLRPRFQLALLGWIRGDGTGVLPQLRQVAERLEAAATSEVVHQLWWVVSGVLEALADQGIEPSVAVKRLIGQADREMKRLYSVGEARFASQPPVDLINNLLYYIARSTSAGERVSAIREAFNLSGLIPGDAQIEAAREGLAAPSVRLMQTVASAISEDLTRVKDVLDIYVRTGMERVDELAPQVELLKRIGDTLGVLGLGELRDMIRTQQAVLEEVVGAAKPATDETLLDMAAAVLSVEDRLERQLVGMVSPGESAHPPVDGMADEPAGRSEVAGAVMRECLANMARVKDAISQVTERNGRLAALDTVPQLLRGIAAALLLLEKAPAAQVIDGIREAIGKVIGPDAASARRQALERLADAIVSVEYYMETLQAGRREPSWMLDNAMRCLASLGELERASAAARSVLVETDHPATVVVGAGDATTPSPDSPAMVAGDAGIDPEILELFIEEAREVVETLEAHFPAWALDQGNDKALLTVRRAFHTLKGSGRMVGAVLIGEFSWSIEHLLNRVIEGSVPAGPDLVAFLRRAITAVPELIEQLEVGQPPASDIADLMAGARRFSEPVAPAAETTGDEVGNATELVPVLDIGAPSAGPLPDADERAVVPADLVGQSPAPAMDPVLFDILSREVASHLAVIQASLAERPVTVTDNLFRAGHTLHGSLTMAGVAAGVAVARPLNDLIAALHEHQLAPDDAMCLAVQDAADFIAGVIDHLRDPDVPLPSGAVLEGRLTELKQLVAEHAARAAEQADGGTLSVELPVLPEVAETPEMSAEGAEAGAESIRQTVFDAEVAAIFAEEAAELLEACDAACARVVAGADRAAALAELQRGLHTLKGGARMAGLAAMGDLSHDLETLIIRIAEGVLEAGHHTWRLLQAAFDELHALREEIPSGAMRPPASTVVEGINAALAGGDAAVVEGVDAAPAAGGATGPVEEGHAEVGGAEPPLPGQGVAAVEGQPPVEGVTSADDVTPTGEELPADESPTARPDLATPGSEDEQRLPDALPPALERLSVLARDLQAPPVPQAESPLFGALRETRGAEPREFARIESGLLEQLLNGAGEISITNSRLAQHLSQIEFNLAELDQTVQRLRDQLRNLEMETEAQILFRHQGETRRDADFDPLELDQYSAIQQLSRGLAETSSDVSSLKDLLRNVTADADALLTQQSRIANELQDGLMRTRMVPFDQHASRLARLVRQTAKETRREAELVIEGSGDLDRQVLEKMLPPFEHMLRNAVVHGIEAPAERLALGKSACGAIRVRIHREGAEVIIAISDDGRGLDVAAIRRKALDLGFIDRDMALTDEEAMQFILRSGFSTADQLTQAAGRGIGMDVVASQVARLGGTLSISSERGKGTTFTLRLPFTLAITQALIVRTGTELYALPLPTVEGIIRIVRRDFEARMAEPEPAIEYGGQKYMFRYLGQYLGLGSARLPDEMERLSVILVRAGENSAALIADEMLDSREIVVKPVGGQLATIRGISGATILGDGRVVIILDAGALVRSARPAPDMAQPQPVETVPREKVALVVDDSITMRRVTQRLLERNGFRVLTAKDGVEAISVLQDNRPDIILLDVEMPRMDGYEFARYVRNNSDTAMLPIIMVTSRVSEKHRARAIEIGVNDYLGKPYQERQLMEAVHHLLSMPKGG